MITVAHGSPSSSVLNSALAWLSAAYGDDPLHDLAPLRHHLRGIAGAGTDTGRRIPLLGLFQKRADAINRSLKTLLHRSSLPLAPRLRLIAQGLTDVHGLLASTLLEAARSPEGAAAETAADVLRNLAEQQQVALMAAANPPAEIWRQAQFAYSLLKHCPPNLAAPGERIFKGMLALAAAQPETFVGHEIAFLIDYLREFAGAVTLDPNPKGPLETWYWLDENRALPPVAATRRPPPVGGKTLYFSCAGLAQATDEHLRRLAAGETAAALGLPADAASADDRLVLGRAQAHWASPPRRRHHHRPSSYAVEICPELDRLWDLLKRSGGGDIASTPKPLTKWMVLNESPGGFAMMHLSGAVSGLVSGGALGLRTSPERPWNICLVRWARSNDAKHVEVGLELIAPAAAPVQIVRRDNTTRSRLAPALLLRTGHGHHRHESLLTYRSGIASRPFTMITEPNGRVQLTECQVHRPALQTASVEILEFMRDFSPSWGLS